MNTESTRPVRRMEIKSAFKSREMFDLFILIAVIVVVMAIAPGFRDAAYVLKSLTRYMEFGLVAMTMTLIIIGGMIDLSAASMMACVATFTAMMFDGGIPMEGAVVLGLCIGFGFGTINGVLIAYANLPSMIVTIGTMSLFRGLSQIFIGDQSLGHFPEWFNSVEKVPVFKVDNAIFSVTILMFIIAAVIFYLILQKTALGRKIYAIGTNEKAAIYAGVHTKKIKCLLFSFSGLMSGLAGILTMSRLLLVRYDMANGAELDVVTMVLIGGADINGGKGTIVGSVLGVLIIAFLQSGLTVAKVKATDQMFVMGVLLLLSIVIPNIGRIIKEKKEG